MFESLGKMVKIENNELFTIDPYAYAESLKKKIVDIINQDNSDFESLIVCNKTSFTI